MEGAMERLLEGGIDYAGLFPPAELTMAEAFNDYLRFKTGPEAWIVGRFVCPAARLPELLPLTRNYMDEVVEIAVIGTPAPDHRTWGECLERDARIMEKFRVAAEGHAEISAFEVKVPDHAHLSEYLRDLHAFDDAEIFVEFPWGDGMVESLGTLAESGFADAKARTGGTRATAFPSSAQLAQFIQCCVQADLPFKCTAGLHHALPKLDPLIEVRMHGFLNVFFAATLALADDLSVREIEDLLNEDKPEAFQVSQDWIGWRSHRADLDQIDFAREILMGFGSCSVEEPLEELQLFSERLESR
jgi:hypothetical protein